MDKTYLARLGFSDPDRKSEVHDKTCVYLARPEVAQKVINFLCDENVRSSVDEELARCKITAYEDAFSDFRCSVSKMITRSSGTIAGYLDVHYLIPVAHIDDGDDGKRHGPFYFYVEIVIEVKTQPVNITQIIQQLATYRYFGNHVGPRGGNYRYLDIIYALCTTYDISDEDKKLLDSEEIKHFKVDINSLQRSDVHKAHVI